MKPTSLKSDIKTDIYKRLECDILSNIDDFIYLNSRVESATVFRLVHTRIGRLVTTSLKKYEEFN